MSCFLVHELFDQNPEMSQAQCMNNLKKQQQPEFIGKSKVLLFQHQKHLPVLPFSFSSLHMHHELCEHVELVTSQAFGIRHARKHYLWVIGS